MHAAVKVKPSKTCSINQIPAFAGMFFKHKLCIECVVFMRLSKQNNLKKHINTALVPLLLAFSCKTFADPQQDIQHLIDRVGALKDATFIRNNSNYSAANAKAFLQRKWKAQCKDAASVQAFIQQCASASSTSGKPYLIKQGERTRPAADVLRELAAQRTTQP
jgi:hypothetical protein